MQTSRAFLREFLQPAPETPSSEHLRRFIGNIFDNKFSYQIVIRVEIVTGCLRILHIPIGFTR